MKKTTTCLVLLFLIATATSFIPGCCLKNLCLKLEQIRLVPKDNSGWDPVEIHGELRARALLLELTGDLSEEICYVPQGSLIPGAYAGNCKYNYREDSIMLFEIYADRRYDAIHDSGVALNDLFNVVNMKDLYKANIKTGAQLYLASTPDDTGTYKFGVRMELKSGKKFDVQTGPIKLLK